jgi:hypothetical protein
MTHHELDQIVADLVTQLSTQGFENPISFAAIERTGRTSSGSSSPTQDGGLSPCPAKRMWGRTACPSTSCSWRRGAARPTASSSRRAPRRPICARERRPNDG